MAYRASTAEPTKHRKQMFMSLMTPERIEQLVQLTAAEWHIRLRSWEATGKVVLYPELHLLLTRATCAWAGVPLADSEVDARTREIAALFDHAGSVGLRHLWSRLARKRADRWAGDIVEQVRSGRIHPPEQSAAHIVAWHRDLNGELLTPHVAAVELINVIRPTVAVSVYLIFVAHALLGHPQVRKRLRAEDDGYAGRFVQEVAGAILSSRQSLHGRGRPSNGTEDTDFRKAGACYSIYTAPTRSRERGRSRRSSSPTDSVDGMAAPSISSRRAAATTTLIIAVPANGWRSSS